MVVVHKGLHLHPMSLVLSSLLSLPGAHLGYAVMKPNQCVPLGIIAVVDFPEGGVFSPYAPILLPFFLTFLVHYSWKRMTDHLLGAGFYNALEGKTEIQHLPAHLLQQGSKLPPPPPVKTSVKSANVRTWNKENFKASQLQNSLPSKIFRLKTQLTHCPGGKK